tara:strand:- start:2291 stop:2410 length:120 start_codon:yes stop_codon:yes gene_type:complete
MRTNEAYLLIHPEEYYFFITIQALTNTSGGLKKRFVSHE